VLHEHHVAVTADAAERWVDQIERETGRYVSDVFA